MRLKRRAAMGLVLGGILAGTSGCEYMPHPDIVLPKVSMPDMSFLHLGSSKPAEPPQPDQNTPTRAANAKLASQRGDAAYARKDYAEALKDFQEAAAQNIASAQNKLGLMYAN